MRTILRAALILGTLSTPMIAFADGPAKPAPKTDTKPTDKTTDSAPKADDTAKTTDSTATTKTPAKGTAKTPAPATK